MKRKVSDLLAIVPRDDLDIAVLEKKRRDDTEVPPVPPKEPVAFSSRQVTTLQDSSSPLPQVDSEEHSIRVAVIQSNLLQKASLASFLNENKLDVALILSDTPFRELYDGFDSFVLPSLPHQGGILLWNIDQIRLIELCTECKYGSRFKLRKTDGPEFGIYLATNPQQPIRKTHVDLKNFLLISTTMENKSSFGHHWQVISSDLRDLRILTGPNASIQGHPVEKTITNIQWQNGGSKHTAKKLVLAESEQAKSFH